MSKFHIVARGILIFCGFFCDNIFFSCNFFNFFLLNNIFILHVTCSLLDAVMKEDVIIPLDDDVTVLNKVGTRRKIKPSTEYYITINVVFTDELA
jgi:hypothetical protein